MLDFVNMPINPDTPRLFTVISTFAGCGGSSLGYKWAGGKVLAAIEWDENAVQTYRLNHKDTPVLHRDITTVTTQELLDLTELQPGELDILDGSPPCQGFSTAGKRQFTDPRNSLFKEYIRLLRGLQPKVFVMENVSGMVKGHMKHIFALIMRELKASGYHVKCQLMNAMYFGVPQSRERVVFIGVRNDVDIEASYPNPISKPPTVQQAIGYLPIGQQGNHEPQILKAWYGSKPGQSLGETNRYVGSYQSVRLDPNKPSTTQIRVHLNWHYALPRQLTIQEASIIQSFPQIFQWIGTKGTINEHIGNSVPPMFMYHIASHIYTSILCKVIQEQEALLS